MRIRGSDQRVARATPTPRGAAVMDVIPADLARERTWRVQAEARAVAAEERARAAEERAAVSAWLVALLRSEMTGAEPWGRRWWWPWPRRATRLWSHPVESTSRGE